MPSHRINADRLRFEGNTSGKDGDVHIEATDRNTLIVMDNTTTLDKGLRADKFASKLGSDIFEWNEAGSKLDVKSNIDFTGITAIGISGGGGATTTSGISSENYVGQTLEYELDQITTTLTTQADTNGISSTNYSGQTLEYELDQITTATTNNTNRTSGLTPLRVVGTNIGGFLTTTSIATANLITSSETTTQSLASSLNLASGKTLKYNSVDLNATHLTDYADLTKDNQVNTATTTALNNKLDIDFSNIGSDLIPDANIPSTITRDTEACLLTTAQTVAGTKTLTDTLVMDGGYNMKDTGMTGSEAWISYSSHPSNHVLVLGWRDAGGTLTEQSQLYANDRIEYSVDIECLENIHVASGKSFMVGTNALASTDLGDTAQIPLLNDTSLNTFNSDILTTGNFRADGGQLQLDNGNTYRLARNTTTGNLDFEIPTGEDYNYYINNVLRLNINNATSIFTGDVYDNGASDANNKLQNLSNATNLVNTILSSTTTANTTKLNLVEGGSGTGFDGSATSFTINQLNPIIIQEFQHRPTGVGGAYVAIPSFNTFTCNCASTFNSTINATSNLIVSNDTTLGSASIDTLTINATPTFATLINTVGITDTNSISTTGLLQGASLVVLDNTTLGQTGTDTLTLNSTIITDVNLTTGGNVVRDAIDYLDRVDDLFTDYRTTVSINTASFVANGVVKLFDTGTTFDVYKYGTDTGVNLALNSTQLTKKTFHMLLSFQGYTSGGAGSSYLFDYGAGGIHSSLKIGAYGVIGHNNVGTNDGVAPNSLTLPNTVAYHISDMNAPTIQWLATTSGTADYNLIWGSSTITAGFTGSTIVSVKLIPIADFI